MRVLITNPKTSRVRNRIAEHGCTFDVIRVMDRSIGDLGKGSVFVQALNDKDSPWFGWFTTEEATIIFLGDT